MTSAPPDPTAHPVRLVESLPDLSAWVAATSEATLVALDVEANSLHAYRERVCVVQATAAGESAILDPLALDSLAPLRDALDTEDVEVVFHGGDFDISVLTRDHDFKFHRVFDTMIAATLLGEPKVGLANLVLENFDVQLDKRFQRADWGHRPLTHEQLDYLHRDTAYLPDLRALLGTRLQDADLVEEAEIEFQRLAGRHGEPAVFDPDGWRRIKGIGSPDAAGRAVAAELWAWREQEAERRDVPPFKVLGPRTIGALARQVPAKLRDPRDLTTLHPGERRRYGEPILDAVRRGVDAAERNAGPPPAEKLRLTPAEADLRRRIRARDDALRAWRRDEATRRKVPNVVVLPNRALTWIASTVPTSVEEIAACTDAGPKRAALYGETILDILTSKKA